MFPENGTTIFWFVYMAILGDTFDLSISIFQYNFTASRGDINQTDIQLSAVLTRFNIARYYMHHCCDRGQYKSQISSTKYTR